AKFELLTHYRTLSCPFIASILEDDPESDRKRLKVLAAEPNRYLNLYNRDKQRLLIGLNGYQWYTLSRRGVDTLRGRGRDIHGSVEGNGREFAHELGINGTLGSIDIGIRQTGGARMVYADEIYNHPNFPDQTRKSHSPFSLKLSIRKKFATGTIHEKTFNYRPDG